MTPANKEWEQDFHLSFLVTNFTICVSFHLPPIYVGYTKLDILDPRGKPLYQGTQKDSNEPEPETFT